MTKTVPNHAIDVLAYAFLILDWEGRPFCHKQIFDESQ